LETFQAGDSTQPQLRENVVRVTYPENSRSGTILTGTQREKASRLLNLFRERALLR